MCTYTRRRVRAHLYAHVCVGVCHLLECIHHVFLSLPPSLLSLSPPTSHSSLRQRQGSHHAASLIPTPPPSPSLSHQQHHNRQRAPRCHRRSTRWQLRCRVTTRGRRNSTWLGHILPHCCVWGAACLPPLPSLGYCGCQAVADARGWGRDSGRDEREGELISRLKVDCDMEGLVLCSAPKHSCKRKV